MLGFEKLIEFLLNSIRMFQFWYVVSPFENAIQLRKGVRIFVRTDPGLYWKRPFFIDEIRRHSIATDTTEFSARQLPTKDGIFIMAGACVVWSVVDAYKFDVSVETGEDALIDISRPALRRVIARYTLQELIGMEPDKLDAELFSTLMKRRPGKWGIGVEAFSLTEFAPARGYRVWGLEKHTV
jgi:regulator of protease activity HflC (stomatin/prohibitin superfamily)